LGVNCSRPAFADGYRLGLGAENRHLHLEAHAYGHDGGLEGLTTQKFVLFGDGQLPTRLSARWKRMGSTAARFNPIHVGHLRRPPRKSR
jgi:hypothetical protein